MELSDKALEHLLAFVKAFMPCESEQTDIYFNDCAQSWLYHFKKPMISPKTFAVYLGIFERHIKPAFSGIKLKDMNALMIQTFLMSFYHSGRERTSEDLKTIIGGTLLYAFKQRKISYNPMDSVMIPKHYRKNGTPLTKQEIASLLHAIKDKNIQYAILLMLYTRIRRGELKSVEIEKEFIIVTNGKTRHGAPKQKRRIPICNSLKAIIKEMKGNKFKYNPQYLEEQFKLVSPKHTLHDLRHTFTTRAIESGIKKAYVDYITGHKSNNMTLGVYTHFDDEFGKSEIKELDY